MPGHNSQPENHTSGRRNDHLWALLAAASEQGGASWEKHQAHGG